MAFPTKREIATHLFYQLCWNSLFTKTEILTSAMYLYLYLTTFIQLSLSRFLCTNIDWKFLAQNESVLESTHFKTSTAVFL